MEIIYDINLKKLDEIINLDNLDIFQLSNLVCDNNKVKINKIEYIIMKENYSD